MIAAAVMAVSRMRSSAYSRIDLVEPHVVRRTFGHHAGPCAETVQGRCWHRASRQPEERSPLKPERMRKLDQHRLGDAPGSRTGGVAGCVRGSACIA